MIMQTNTECTAFIQVLILSMQLKNNILLKPKKIFLDEDQRRLYVFFCGTKNLIDKYDLGGVIRQHQRLQKL